MRSQGRGAPVQKGVVRQPGVIPALKKRGYALNSFNFRVPSLLSAELGEGHNCT